jgi:hypothetical protein
VASSGAAKNGASVQSADVQGKVDQRLLTVAATALVITGGHEGKDKQSKATAVGGIEANNGGRPASGVAADSSGALLIGSQQDAGQQTGTQSQQQEHQGQKLQQQQQVGKQEEKDQVEQEMAPVSAVWAGCFGQFLRKGLKGSGKRNGGARRRRITFSKSE